MINGISSYGSYMSYQQIQSMQQQRGPAEMFDKVDTDESGGISQTELDTLAESISDKTGQTIDTEDAVSTYDIDGDGELSKEELQAFLDASGLEPPSMPGMGMMGIQQAMSSYSLNSLGSETSTLLDFLTAGEETYSPFSIFA
ncbi:MAG TPA: EF-hand domain-containing protein [Deltaproteobacteria bacterium]|nr:EF-hand domain-containing protein [Deltaproteobacteria bacterium]